MPIPITYATVKYAYVVLMLSGLWVSGYTSIDDNRDMG